MKKDPYRPLKALGSAPFSPFAGQVSPRYCVITVLRGGSCSQYNEKRISIKTRVNGFYEKMSAHGTIPTMSDARGYLRPDQVRTLIDATTCLRDRTMFQILWATGARLNEMLMLTVSDIWFTEKVLYCWTLKRKLKRRYQRVVIVDSVTMDMIKQYLELSGIREGLLFTITDRRVQYIVTEAGARAGITRVGSKKIHPHHFRHSHAVAWVRANPTMEGLRKLQTRLGHASFATTAHYLQYAFDEQRGDVETVLGSINA